MEISNVQFLSFIICMIAIALLQMPAQRQEFPDQTKERDAPP